MVAGISNFAVLSKTLFADVFYSDDPVSDTDQPKYVDQSVVGYYGSWWIWHTAADGTVTLTTECFENIVLMLPFTALLLWTVAEKIFCGRKITFGRCVWISTKTAFLFSLAIEFLQLFLRLGTFQLSDLFYNTLGGVLGGMIYWICWKIRGKKQKTGK